MTKIRLRCLLGFHSYGQWGPVFIKNASRYQDRECGHCCKVRERIL